MAGITGAWGRSYLLEETWYMEEETVSRGIVEEITESVATKSEGV